jgi:hypothetical protein
MTCFNRLRKKAKGIKKEAGIAMVLVLVGVVMLSVLGAASLLLMVSAVRGMVNMKPEDRAFQVAESGLYVAHARIVTGNIPTGPIPPGSILGGQYQITIQPTSSTDYTVTSEGTYESNGRTYRRKLQESIYYSGDQAYDAMRNYMFFAGRDLNMDLREGFTLGYAVNFNGNMRAQEDANIFNGAAIAGTGVTINGNLEAKRTANLTTGAYFICTNVTKIYGHIKTGDSVAGTPGTVNLTASSAFLAYAELDAAYSSWNIYADTVTEHKSGFLSGVQIKKGTVVNQKAVGKIYIPEPNFDYYKAIAIDQGHYYPNSTTINDLSIGTSGLSSGTVIYCAGDLTINGSHWRHTSQPTINGTIVCEGNFRSTSSWYMDNGAILNVIAKGNATFDNSWTFSNGSASSQYLVWTGNDANLDLAMFADQKCQITALRDINIESIQTLGSTVNVGYLAPQIDVVAWPIKISTTNWKELPADQ